MDGLDILETIQKYLSDKHPGESVKVRLAGGDKFLFWLWTSHGHALSTRGDISKHYPGEIHLVPSKPEPGQMVRYGTDRDLAAIQAWTTSEIDSMKTV